MRDGDVVTFHDGQHRCNRIEGGPVLEQHHTLRQDALRAGLAEARARGVDHVATYAAACPSRPDLG